MPQLNTLHFPGLDSQLQASAELQAMALDGEVYPLADGYAMVDAPLTPQLKARAVCLDFCDRLVPAGLSALWVWGLVFEPRTHTVALRTKMRANHATLDRRRVRELEFDAQSLQQAGELMICSPTRAVADLLRDPQHYSSDVRSEISTLLCRYPELITSVREYLLQQSRIPYTQDGLRELALAHSIHVVDGIDTANRVENTL